MSRIDELIAELCPDGVEFRPLGELCKVLNGYAFKSSLFNDEGLGLPLIRIRDVNTAFSETYYSGDYDSRYLVGDGDILIGMDGDFRAIRWTNGRALLNQRVCRIQDFSTLVLSGFIYHFLQTELRRIQDATQQSTVKHLSSRELERVSVPVPPLEVQREIVRILDLFTMLEAELEAELEARRRQYAHYRDSLLSFPEGGVRWAPMGEVTSFMRGTGITEKGVVPGSVPVVANGPVPVYFHDTANRTGETIVVARSGAYAGAVSYWDQPLFLTDAFSIQPNTEVLRPKYVFYWLRTQQNRLHGMKKGGGVPHVRVRELEREAIPIPRLEEQARIVAVLDKFDALVNDLSIGLPAELAARRTQYEYYRDRLLTFKEAVA